MDFLSNKFLNISDSNCNNENNKIMQFGGGNFLRAFVDSYLDDLNCNGLLNSNVTVIQPIREDTTFFQNFRTQDYNYTLLERGIENNITVNKNKIIKVIDSYIDPYSNFSHYLQFSKNEHLQFVISNTTEAGIVYDKLAKFDDKPQNSFPGKLTRFLYERFKHFNGDKSKGLIFLPCELIDNNGDELKKIILQHANDWSLENIFIEWINDYNYFTNTLVDRIVPGFPKDEIDIIQKDLGYIDNFIVAAEPFNFWAIEGPIWIKEYLPFDKLNLNVIWTADVTPYKTRKVRILNGAHTSSVLAAYLCGFSTVKEMVENDVFNVFLNKTLFDEIIPTLNLPEDELIDFTNSVFDRFKNPFIKHYLINISLNSVSKYKARVVPSIIKYYEIFNKIPSNLTFSFASLIVFYRGTTLDGQLIDIKDDDNVLKYFSSKWNEHTNNETLLKIIIDFCEKEDFFGANLNLLNGFSKAVYTHTIEILNGNIQEEIKRINNI